MVGGVWEKRESYLVQKDEGRSLGLRGKCKFLGLVKRVREDTRKTKWFQASGTNGPNTQQYMTGGSQLHGWQFNTLPTH